MAFTISSFGRIRPFVYHLTANQNLSRIKRTRLLESAAILMNSAGDTGLLTKKRHSSIQIDIAGELVHIRDQAPLHEGNISFQDGWSLAKLIGDLNHRVFFWPGTGTGPIAYGVRHYERYRDDGPSILRIPFDRLMDRNPESSPDFCKFNSGSPRCSGGRGSLRSGKTFVSADEAEYAASKVVEVTFVNRICLPDEVHISDSPNGPWHTL